MAELDEAFALFNKRYFRGNLPVCTLRWADLGQHLFGQYTYDKYNPVPHKIELSGWTRPLNRVWKFTLLHEMVHLKLMVRCGSYNHGHHFQREMKRLANRGAFNGLW